MASTTEQPWLAVGRWSRRRASSARGGSPPLQSPLAWQLPAFLWVAEAAWSSACSCNPLPEAAGAGFAYLAAVAWHRYDVVYRLRDTGSRRARVGHRW